MKKWQAGLMCACVAVLIFVIGGMMYMEQTKFATTGSGISQGAYNTVAPEMAMRDAADSPAADMALTEESMASGVGIGGQAATGHVPLEDRLIIKTGSLSMEVKDVRETIQQIATFAVSQKGFVVQSDVNEENVPRGYITVRIPSAVFDTGISEIKKWGRVQSENVTGQDVTEEYVDLDSRLKNLRASEEQFLEIMQRATRIEDVLAVQRELTNVRTEIEMIEGRMKYLKESSQLSTLTVFLATDPSSVPVIDRNGEWNPGGTFKTAVRALVDAFKYLGNAIIWIVIVVVPVALACMFVVWVVYRIVKSVQRKTNRNSKE